MPSTIPPEGDGIEMQARSHRGDPRTETAQPVVRMTDADTKREYDAALEKRINDDPFSTLHQDDFNHAVNGMTTARDARALKAPEQSASRALTSSAKKLDAARNGVESSAVGATTGGIISWNHHIQGEHTN